MFLHVLYIHVSYNDKLIMNHEYIIINNTYINYYL
jgi:hypothetical protein